MMLVFIPFSEMEVEEISENTDINSEDNISEKTENDEVITLIENDFEKEDEIPFLNLTIKPDQFDGINILKDSFEKIGGAPNFRQIKGFPIYGTGQPTALAMVDVINRVKRNKENETILWFSMRQEPIVYVNGEPYALRALDKPHENIGTKLNIEQIKKVQFHLADMLRKKLDDSGDKTLKIHKDKAFEENAMDRVDYEVTLEVDSIDDLESVYENCRKACNVNLEIINIPIREDKGPDMLYFDTIVTRLKDEPASTPCVFSCQSGKGRTTVGLVAALLIKEIQITTEMR